MAETINNVPVKIEKTPASPQARRPFKDRRREIDSLVEISLADAHRPPVARSWTSERPGDPKHRSRQGPLTAILTSVTLRTRPSLAKEQLGGA
jgi:hypothetical protein